MSRNGNEQSDKSVPLLPHFAIMETVDKVQIKEICEWVGISRPTHNKYLRIKGLTGMGVLQKLIERFID